MVQMCRDQIPHLAAVDQTAHAGLLLSSYLRSDDPQSRRQLFDVARGAAARAGCAYTEAYNLWRDSVSKDCITELVEVDGRAVIGLGAASPLETGLTLHHTYGVPYIPGCALKGLAAHYCHSVWGASNGDFARGGGAFNILFGTTEDGGHIIFNDAWISPDSLADCLDIDVMTVHHADYYRARQSKPPSDFDDPNPIAFLSVKGQFWLSLMCDDPGNSGKAWAKLAMTLLLEALANWGIGAKTNAGYGRMSKAGAHPAQTSAVVQHNGGGAVYAGSRHTSVTQLPCKAGDRVEASLSDEKTKKGGWKAIYKAGGQRWIGPIQNTAAVPADAKPGDNVTLIIKSINAKDIAFAWPPKA